MLPFVCVAFQIFDPYILPPSTHMFFISFLPCVECTMSFSFLVTFIPRFFFGCNCKWHCFFNFSLRKCVISIQKCKKLGHLGGSIGEASAFCSGHDPRVLGSSPVLGSPLSEGLLLRLSDTPPARAFSLPVK